MPAVNYLTYVKHRKALEDIRDIVIDAIDGEPTTADDYNKVYISDINKEIVEENTMQEDEKLIFKEQFGGDTGIDADYYDENNEEYIK